MGDPYTDQARALGALSAENGVLRVKIERLNAHIDKLNTEIEKLQARMEVVRTRIDAASSAREGKMSVDAVIAKLEQWIEHQSAPDAQGPALVLEDARDCLLQQKVEIKRLTTVVEYVAETSYQPEIATYCRSALWKPLGASEGK